MRSIPTKGRWLLLAAGLVAEACNSSPDLCTRVVDVGQAIASKAASCVFVDGGASNDLADAGQVAFEIDRCRDQIAGCNAQDLTTLDKSATCLEQLPTLQCQWVTDLEKQQLDPDALLWVADLEACKTGPTSSTCNVSLPFDAGLPF